MPPQKDQQAVQPIETYWETGTLHFADVTAISKNKELLFKRSKVTEEEKVKVAALLLDFIQFAHLKHGYQIEVETRCKVGRHNGIYGEGLMRWKVVKVNF